MARPRSITPPTRKGPRANQFIEAQLVRLIDETGENRGETPLAEALQVAVDAGLDLVEISPNAEPPVCKVMDYGKFKFEAQKKAAEAKKKQKTVEVKEIKMRPGIDQHDFDVKLRSMRKFFDAGDKVKVTMRFRGREMAHQELGMKVLERVKENFGDEIKVEQTPKMEGRQITMVISTK